MRDAEITSDNNGRGGTITMKRLLWLYKSCGSKMCWFKTLALLVEDNPESGKPNRPSSWQPHTHKHKHRWKQRWIRVAWRRRRLWLIVLSALLHGWMCPPVSKGAEKNTQLRCRLQFLVTETDRLAEGGVTVHKEPTKQSKKQPFHPHHNHTCSWLHKNKNRCHWVAGVGVASRTSVEADKTKRQS